MAVLGKGFGRAMQDGVAEGLGLIPAEEAEWGVISVEPGWMSGKVALLGTHLMYAASHEPRKGHEGVE